MGKIIAFTFVSVDGYFAGPDGEIDWFSNGNGDDDKEFSLEASKSSGTLIFGHTTYEMMAGYWVSLFFYRLISALRFRNSPTPGGMRNVTE